MNVALVLILAMIAAGVCSIVWNLQAITSGPK